ncbi:hypothetical protein QNO06_04770 [Arthrobacter sp. zg-Y20]|nr:hypothetical protein [Arthrobacter sp. zg-Y20]WIB07044.1 hypothetical protein QNO06_04770 [Arthrobacter sp. zg-Y20]
MVEQLTSQRTYVNVGNIVEGGTINESVGTALTETVQKEIVIERQNLAEAALTDVVVTGTISSKGKTAENPPRNISVSMTTVSRNLLGQEAANPGIFFEVEGVDRALSPGVYSADGESLYLGSSGRSGGTLMTLGPTTRLVSDNVAIGGLLSSLIEVNTPGRTVSVGDTAAYVNLLGNVKVNGNLLDVQHAEFTTVFSLPTGTTNRKPTTPFTPDQTTTKNGSYATPAEAGAITLTAGVYAITYRADCGAPMGAQGRIAILNSDETRTHINMPIPNEWDGTLTTPNLYLPTTQKIVFTVKQTSGTTLNCNIRVAIEKLK